MRKLLPHSTNKELQDAGVVYGWQVYTKSKLKGVRDRVSSTDFFIAGEKITIEPYKYSEFGESLAGKVFNSTYELIKYLKRTVEDGSWDVMIYNKA